MTRDKAIAMARETGAPDWWIGIGGGPATGWVSALVEKAVAAERERIAAEFDLRAAPAVGFYEPDEPAQIIRAMGDEPQPEPEVYTPPPPTPEQLRINEMKRGILSRILA